MGESARQTLPGDDSLSPLFVPYSAWFQGHGDWTVPGGVTLCPGQSLFRSLSQGCCGTTWCPICISDYSHIVVVRRGFASDRGTHVHFQNLNREHTGWESGSGLGSHWSTFVTGDKSLNSSCFKNATGLSVSEVLAPWFPKSSEPWGEVSSEETAGINTTQMFDVLWVLCPAPTNIPNLIGPELNS